MQQNFRHEFLSDSNIWELCGATLINDTFIVKTNMAAILATLGYFLIPTSGYTDLP